jgi:hypothetical protein
VPWHRAEGGIRNFLLHVAGQELDILFLNPDIMQLVLIALCLNRFVFLIIERAVFTLISEKGKAPLPVIILRDLGNQVSVVERHTLDEFFDHNREASKLPARNKARFPLVLGFSRTSWPLAGPIFIARAKRNVANSRTINNQTT